MRFLRPRIVRFAMALSALMGLFASGYLFYTYVTGARIACIVVSGCDVIRASAWAWVMGVPRPLLGVVFYSFVFGLLVLRTTTHRFNSLLRFATLAAAIIGFIESGILFFIQWLDLRAFCFWCLLSGIASSLLLFFALFDRPNSSEELSDTAELKSYFSLLLLFALISFFGFSLLL